MKEWVGDGIPNNSKYDCWQIKTVYDSTVKCSELWVIRLDEIHFILLQTTTSMWWLESPQFNATLYNGRLYTIALCSWECWYKTCPDDEPSCTAFGSLSVNAVCRSVDWSLLRPARGAPSIVMSVSVCLSVCVCLSAIISPELHVRFPQNFFACQHGRGSVLHWRRSDTLRISGFVDDVIFAHKLIRCSTSPPGWGSEAHTYAALGLARRQAADGRGYFSESWPTRP